MNEKESSETWSEDGDDDEEKIRRRTETGVKVVDDRPQGSLPLDLSRERSVDGESGDDGESEGGDDVDVLVESREGDGREGLLLGKDLANVVVLLVRPVVDGGGLTLAVSVVVVGIGELLFSRQVGMTETERGAARRGLLITTGDGVREGGLESRRESLSGRHGCGEARESVPGQRRERNGGRLTGRCGWR